MCVRKSYTSLFASDRVSDLEHGVALCPWPTLLSGALPINSDFQQKRPGIASTVSASDYLRIERVERERALHDICLSENLFQLSEAFLCVMMHSTLSGWPGSCNLFSCSLNRIVAPY